MLSFHILIPDLISDITPFANYYRLTANEKKFVSHVQMFFKHVLAIPFLFTPILLSMGLDPYYFLLKKFLPLQITNRVDFRIVSSMCRFVVFFVAYLEIIRITSVLIAIAISGIMVMKRIGRLWQSLARESPRRGSLTIASLIC